MSSINWAIAVPLVMILLTMLASLIKVFLNSKNVQNHPALAIFLQDALDIANQAIAFLQANPSMTPADAKAWAVKELKATATPQTITSLGNAATDEALGFLMNKKMVSAAMAAPVSDATKAIIADLAPSALTSRITPPQVSQVAAALGQAVSAEAPLTIKTLLEEFPALAGIRIPANATVSVTPAPASALDAAQGSSPGSPGVLVVSGGTQS